jgi:flagellar protein FlaG
MQLDLVSKVNTALTKSTGTIAKPLPARQENAAAGKASPVQQEPQLAGQSTQAVELAVTQLNDYVQSFRTDLEFIVDEGSGRSIVQVFDSESGELIRQIPSEEVLAVSRAIDFVARDQSTGILVRDQA